MVCSITAVPLTNGWTENVSTKMLRVTIRELSWMEIVHIRLSSNLTRICGLTIHIMMDGGDTIHCPN